ncbi:MAG: type I secretion system permease/ATPase [Alphaproteobacteria bacterium]|nr:type I secretion system permease/ATPase [Alphaproteobacteria bacterium]
MTGGGERELRAALSESRRLFLSVGFFSVFVNVLMLTGPLFMLQVYDRVLTSRSEATLVTLVAITAFLFLMMGVLDYARGRVLARAGARLQARLDARVLRAMLARAVSPAERARPATGLRDLEAMQRFASGTGPFAFFDAPWTPVFLGVLFMFHWMLGLLAVFSGVLLLVLALLNQARTGRLQQELGEAAARSAHFVEQMRAGSETVQGLGMQDAVVAQSGALRGALLDRTLAASDRSGFFGVTTKTLRLFLQSMMLGLGAWLAIQGLVSFGVIIAASILLGRALAPIDQAVGQWPLLQRVLAARRSLARLLEETPPDAPRTALPVPRALLEVQGLTVAAPGARVAAVRGAAFRLEPGRAAGIAGASASGKSTLARALAGVYRPLAGSVRLDGAELDQYGADLGHHVGYLPQEVVLFEGTVARNIARFAPDAKDEDVVEAAKRTGAHEMILKLPGGYDFQVSAGGAALSGGQRQRIALARAFYGSPVVVVMDEPDSNLDAEGTMALAGAIEGHKKRGGAAVVVAHRHGAFAQCDTVYVMEAGRPVPAGRRKAPVRQLQAGAAEGEAPERTSPAADGRAAAAPAAGAAGEAPGDARVVRIPTGDAAPRRKLPGREQQIADAIARVTDVRLRPARDGGDQAGRSAGDGASVLRMPQQDEHP